METKNATPHTLGRQFQGIFFKHKITLSRDESLTRFSRGRKIVTRLSQGQQIPPHPPRILAGVPFGINLRGVISRSRYPQLINIIKI